MLRYHEKTFQLLGNAPSVSSEAIEELELVEQRIGRRLPESVREWYSQEGACQILARNSNGDPPLEVAQFGLPRTDTHGRGPYDLLAEDRLVFRYENQSVCVWAIQLDGSDDPPVVIDFDSQFQTWTERAATFSEHLYAWMWDFASVLQRDLVIQAQNQELSMAAIECLRYDFDAGPVTYGWPGRTQYRFSKEDQRLLIWASERQADWWLTADRDDSLRRLIGTVSGYDDVGKSFWSHTAQGEALLKSAQNPT